MPVSNATNATDKYRAKAYELLSLAERAGDPEQRADLLRFARKTSMQTWLKNRVRPHKTIPQWRELSSRLGKNPAQHFIAAARNATFDQNRRCALSAVLA